MRILKVLLVFNLLISVMISSNYFTVSAQPNDESDIATFIDQVMQEQIEQENISNASISIVSNGEVIFQKGYGYEDRDAKDLVSPETSLFRIGSISKLFTWTAIMKLVEQGKLDLDVDINEYLDFEIPSKLENKQKNSNSQPITLRHLMTHTPGFEDYPDTVYKLSEDKMLSLQEYVHEHLPKRVFPAGEVVAYSNYGSALAGYIVEKVSGKPYSQYIEQHIFKPLNMTNSTFEQPLPNDLNDQMVKPYRYIDEEFREGSFEYLPGPAGAMSSSASDMASFMNVYLQGGRFEDIDILEDATIQQMFTQQFSQHPRVDGMGLGFMEGTFNGQRTLFHSGSTMLFDSVLYLIPDKDIGIFITYSGGNHFLHNEVFQQFMDEYFPVQKTSNLTAPEGSEGRGSKFVGEYHQNRKSFTTSEKFVSLTMGMIQVDIDEEGYLSVNHIGETNRFVEVEPGIYESIRTGRTPDAVGDFRTIVFETDSNGETMLITDGPMTYSKAPWYGTSSFTFSFLAIAVLFIVGTFIYWIISAVIRIVLKKTDHNKGTLLAKLTAIVFAILTICLLIGIGISGEVDPVYQLPKVAYGILPSWSSLLDFIPYLMAFFGVILLIFTLIIWRHKLGKIVGRIHFTLLSASAIFLVWLFSYWNLL